MEKNFKLETLNMLEFYNHSVYDVLEYSIEVNLPEKKELYIGNSDTFLKVLDQLDINYSASDRYEGLSFKGWIAFKNSCFAERHYHYQTYYSHGIEEWNYIKFPKLISL